MWDWADVRNTWSQETELDLLNVWDVFFWQVEDLLICVLYQSEESMESIMKIGQLPIEGYRLRLRIEFQCFALSWFAVFAAGFLLFVSGNSTLVQTTEINARSELGVWNLGRTTLPTLSDWCCMIPRRFWGAWVSGEDRHFCYDWPSVLT